MDIVSSPKVGPSLSKTIMLVVRSSGLWEADTQTYPKWDKICTTACWCRSMIACQVSWISDEFWIYLNLKNQVSECLRPSDGGRVFDIHSHFLHGTKACNQGHIFEFLTNLYALEHVHAVKIWIMNKISSSTQLMHKNIQTNPEKSQKLTQHSYCSMLTLEFFWKQ